MHAKSLTRQAQIKIRLEKALTLESLEIIDESHQHKGHVGAQGGASHFAITVVSPQFTDLSPIQRHRLVYAALNEMIPNEIHALKIKALTPQQ